MSRPMVISGKFHVLVTLFLALAGCSGQPSSACAPNSVGGNGTNPCGNTGGASGVGGLTSVGGNSSAAGSPANSGGAAGTATGGAATGGAATGGLATGGFSAAGNGTAGAVNHCQATDTNRYLTDTMDQYHRQLYVYKDKDCAGNHFAARGLMGDQNTPAMNEDHHANCATTAESCIEATYQPGAQGWGGWYFLNGVLSGTDRGPSLNWGDTPNAGFDLRGATHLRFRARGALGGERVEFFALGVGRDAGTGAPNKPYPDSSAKATLGFVTLTPKWKDYELDVSNRDLSYVLGGFGWVTSSAENQGNAITFYLDDIYYDKPALDEPRFLVSYITESSASLDFDSIMRNVAFTYDNAVTLIYFLSVGETERARLMADALVYAQNHDRYFDDGRLRNAYQAGDLRLPPGWNPNGKADTVRMPGRSDVTGIWWEDAVQVGTSVGNAAWALLGLLGAFESLGDSKYLDAAVRLGSWIENNCRVVGALAGYSGGFEGWEPGPNSAGQTKLLYRSTEHNLDLFAAFSRLARLTGNDTWSERAQHARTFVQSMWSASEGHFWTGTVGVTEGDDTINTSVVPLDAQSWTLLSMRDWQQDADHLRGISYAETHCSVAGGFDFDSDQEAIWIEGTAQMGVLYRLLGRAASYQQVMDTLAGLRGPNGGFPATSAAELHAGPSASPWWTYYPRYHVGATGWVGLAECGTNPFWFPN